MQTTLTSRTAPATRRAPVDPPVFGTLLVGVDGTARGRDAIALAKTLRAPRARITLVHVVLTQAPISTSFFSTWAWREAQALLTRERARAQVRAGLTGTASDSVGHGLQQLAGDRSADLLVVGSCGRSAIGRLLRGDDTRGSIKRAPCAVAVAPPGFARGSARLEVIGVDAGDSGEALRLAREIGARHGAAVRDLTVSGSEQPLDLMTERRRAERLLRASAELDLLVVGMRDDGWVRRLVCGSAPLRLARAARCPTLISKQAGR